MADNNKLNNSAHQKLPTSKPLISLSARRTINALITSKNNPRVASVTGNVSRMSNGVQYGQHNGQHDRSPEGIDGNSIKQVGECKCHYRGDDKADKHIRRFNKDRSYP